MEAGEELCICYSADESKLWFTPSNLVIPNGNHSLDEDESEDEEDILFPGIEPEDLVTRVKERAGIDLAPLRFDVKDKKQAKSLNKPNSYKPKPTITDLEEPVILEPRPVHFTGSLIPNNVLPSIPRSNLPTPLHSGPKKGYRHVHVGPVVLTDELDWRQDDWFVAGEEKVGNSEGSLSELERIKGPAETDDNLVEDEAMRKLAITLVL